MLCKVDFLEIRIIRLKVYCVFSGFFKSLNQEFTLTGTPIAVTIMPLPYVFTKRVSAGLRT